MPTIVDLEQFNRELLSRCDDDMKREHYRNQELICDLFKEDLKSMLPLPKERFKVTRLIKGKTDNYSFVPFENNKYSTAPEYSGLKRKTPRFLVKKQGASMKNEGLDFIFKTLAKSHRY